MIVDKQKKIQLVAPTLTNVHEIVEEGEDVEKIDNNPLIDVYLTVKKVLEKIRVNPKDPDSPRLFKTVKIDNGQFERIVLSKENTEYAVAFPAVFIRFVNVRYLVQQQRIGEGRAMMRIRFILNNLNTSDDEIETEGFRVFQLINNAIQDAKSTEPAINERCNLLFFDMPETLAHGLQPYWVDYEIWFRESSSFQYRNWVERYIVMPPFTNHSDAPEHDTEGHGDHKAPSYDDVTKFEPTVETWLPSPLPGVLK